MRSAGPFSSTLAMLVGRVEPLVESAGELHRALREELGQPVLGHVEIRIAPQVEAMVALAPRDLQPRPDAEGATYATLSLDSCFPCSSLMGRRQPNLKEVYQHHLAHVALFDAVRGATRYLRWFLQGLRRAHLGVSRHGSRDGISLESHPVGASSTAFGSRQSGACWQRRRTTRMCPICRYRFAFCCDLTNGDRFRLVDRSAC